MPSPVTRFVLLALFVLLAPACSGPQNYLERRYHDVTDIVDLKYGGSLNSMGLGVKVEITNYLGLGLAGGTYEEIRESYGRRLYVGPAEFLHLAFFGIDGPSIQEDTLDPRSESYGLIVNWTQEQRPPVIDRMRIGAELLLFTGEGGFYLNFGQMADLVLGIFMFDPAGDDNLADDSPW